MNTLLTMNTAAPCQELEGEPVSALGTPSYGQRSLWFLQHLTPQGGAYNIAAAARVRTPIEAGALEHAFQALVDRHAALRTTFPAIDGAPCRREIRTLCTSTLGRPDGLRLIVCGAVASSR